jgi:hypothetical protein
VTLTFLPVPAVVYFGPGTLRKALFRQRVYGVTQVRMDFRSNGTKNSAKVFSFVDSSDSWRVNRAGAAIIGELRQAGCKSSGD